MKGNGRKKNNRSVTVTKKKKTQLELATERVVQMQEAVASMEANYELCKQDFESAKVAFEEAQRNMNDTFGLLNAQQQKLEREKSGLADILFGGMSIKCHPDASPF